jgi:hypothetical protein
MPRLMLNEKEAALLIVTGLIERKQLPSATEVEEGGNFYEWKFLSKDDIVEFHVEVKARMKQETPGYQAGGWRDE